jgi:hypothetical protein
VGPDYINGDCGVANSKWRLYASPMEACDFVLSEFIEVVRK